jgi:hypothetical protein
MEDFIEKAHNNEVVNYPFVTSMKDERRAPEKVDALKTRIFSAATVEYVILFRAYFLPLLNYFRQNRIKNGIAVGTNYYSEEWDLIANEMLTFGDGNIIAGDFSGFDGSLQQELIDMIGEMLINMCDTKNNEKDQKVRKALWRNISHSTHIVGAFVLAFSRSNPSGCPITTELNSLYNIIATIYAYGRVAVKMENFYKDVFMVAYGDDNIITIDQNSVFKLDDLQDGYKELGLTFTSSDKTGKPFRTTLSKITFLKRAFYKDLKLGRYVCRLDHSAIEDMINWTRDDLTTTFIQILEAALFEESLYGRQSYEAFANAIKDELSKGSYPRLLTQLKIYDYKEKVEDYFMRGTINLADPNIL